MKRRDFLAVCGAGVTAGYANTDSVSGAESASNGDVQALELRLVGLNALLMTSKNGEDISADIVGLDSAGVALPDKSTMHPHSTLLAIATEHLADPALGTGAAFEHCKKWRLNTSVHAFRYWDVSHKTLSIENVVGPNLQAGVFGAVPLKRLNSGLTTTNWRKRTVASTRLRLDKGQITDDVSRVYASGAHRRRWRFTKEDDFKSVEDTPVSLTDTLRVFLTAKTTAPVAFKIDDLTPIATKGPKVEAFLITLPHALTKYEEDHYLRLHHIAAAYQLFDDPPKEPLLPTSDTSGGGEEPVFCPPALFTEGN